MALTIELPVNVKLTKTDKKKLKDFVIDTRNKRAACKYAGMDARTFDKVMDKTPISEVQYKKLMEFCEHVEKAAA